MNHKTGLPNDDALPPIIRKINRGVLWAMAWVNGFAHLVLGIALAASVFLFTWLFLDDVVSSFASHNLASGFLHGLGSLMLLWTVSALITAEIRYLNGVPLTVDTFVEVAIVVILRKLITMPVQQASTQNPQDFFYWVISALLLGVMYLIVRYALTIKHPN
jgi:uncharacterized membrane protein (DUF373 family)